MFRVFGVEQGNILKSLIFSCVEIFLSTVSLLNYFCHVVFILILSWVYLIFSCFDHIKGNLHFNKKITLNHRKKLLQSSQSEIFVKKAFVSERNNFICDV